MSTAFPTSWKQVARRSLSWSRLLFTPLSLLVIGWFLWDNRTAYPDLARNGNWLLLTLSTLLWCLGNLLSPLVTRNLFRSCNINMEYPVAAFIHCNRLPGKYLPGSIWHTVGRASDYLQMGISGKAIGQYFILENILLIGVTFLVSAGLVSQLVSNPLLADLLLALEILALLGLLTLPLMVQLMTRGRSSLAIRHYFAAVILQTGYWCLLGTAFVCYLAAFRQLEIGLSWLQVGAVYIFSWCVGYLALFAPQGIGISEYVSGTLLLPGSQAVILLPFLVGFRLLILVADLLCWAGTKLIKKPETRHDQQ